MTNICPRKLKIQSSYIKFDYSPKTKNMSVVISFTKVDLPYGWMGNMSPFKVVYDG